jgi:hypothetical protein
MGRSQGTGSWVPCPTVQDPGVREIVRPPPGVQGHLVQSAPERFFVPGYLGTRGWVGLRLDGRTVDWGEVEGLLRTAQGLVRPKQRRAT